MNSRKHRALVFCRYLSGHRQIYAYVFTRYLLARGFSVTVAFCPGQSSPLLNLLRSEPDIEFIQLETSEFGSERFSLEALMQLQSERAIDLSFFADADELRWYIKSDRASICQLGPSLGVFLKLTWYAPLSLRSRQVALVWSIIRHMRNRWNDFQFFSRVLAKCKGQFQAFVLDPRFPHELERPYLHWLPDIYEPFDAAADLRQDDIFADMRRFLEERIGSECILYYGTNQVRRGYEWLLQLVVSHPGTIFLHCGRLDENQDMSETAREYRALLQNEGRIYETKVFVTDRRITECAYNACDYVLLPYQSHYGSSGIMLQAASYGKPVLVPRGGLMAYWVEKYQFGQTFLEGSYKDFLRAWEEMRLNHVTYEAPAARFGQMFDARHVYESLDRGLMQVIVRKD